MVLKLGRYLFLARWSLICSVILLICALSSTPKNDMKLYNCYYIVEVDHGRAIVEKRSRMNWENSRNLKSRLF